MFDKKKNVEYIIRCMKEKNRLFYITEPLRMCTIYWALNSLALMKEVVLLENLAGETEAFVIKCQNPDGGFGGNVDYPSSPISTLCALQVLYLLKRNREIYNKYYKEAADLEAGSAEQAALKRPGEFTIRDRWREMVSDPLHDPGHEQISLMDSSEGSATDLKRIPNLVMCNAYLEGIVVDNQLQGYAEDMLDLRCICCYVCSKNMLGQLSPTGPELFVILPQIRNKICEYIGKCTNLDGGMGAEPGCESHSAHTFCGLSALYFLDSLGAVDEEECARFLAMQQKESGGISGRVDKIEDVCYSFWSYSSLMLLQKEKYVQKEKLRSFVLSCESESGGFSDRPGKVPDLFHTMFSLAALGMLGSETIMDVVPSLALCVYD